MLFFIKNNNSNNNKKIKIRKLVTKSLHATIQLYRVLVCTADDVIKFNSTEFEKINKNVYSKIIDFRWILF